MLYINKVILRGTLGTDHRLLKIETKSDFYFYFLSKLIISDSFIVIWINLLYFVEFIDKIKMVAD